MNPKVSATCRELIMSMDVYGKKPTTEEGKRKDKAASLAKI